jgi:predicted heme/steroid binding protein
MNQKIRILIFILQSLLLFAGCAPAKTAGDTETAAGEELQLTLVELAAYNGQDGNPAYIAVDGVIYDVTDVPQWKGGKHMGYLGGIDATEALKSSPHGIGKLKGIPIVGTVSES